MAGTRPGVMLYFETLQAIEELEAEDAKQIMSAILHYSRDGELPAFRGTLAAVWSLIQSSLDRDGDRYGAKQMRGLWLTYCRKCKSTGESPLGFDEWVSAQQDNGTLPYVERTVNEAVNVPSPSTSTSATPSPSGSPSPTIESIGGVGDAPNGAPPSTPSVDNVKKSVRKKYGQYGWVKLSDEEYSRLLNELGQTELERCITYIDEAAQSTGNKNKWRDWNLVICRCHRDGWGLGKGASKPNARPFPSDADYLEGWEDVL